MFVLYLFFLLAYCDNILFYPVSIMRFAKMFMMLLFLQHIVSKDLTQTGSLLNVLRAASECVCVF